jgi:hypothetical protein
MVRIARVQSQEVLAIYGANDPVLSDSDSENSLIWHRPIRVPSFEAGQHIMTKLSKRLDNWEWKVLIGVELHHRLCSLILCYLCLDLLSVRSVIRPGVDEVFRS